MGRARLLVVDDDAGMLHATERVLRGQYEVKSALTPTQALELASGHPFDLAIIDIRMPEMDGFELMARLKEDRPDMDVLLMTGSINDTDARLTRAIRENAFFFISKPFHRDVLLSLVSRCLENRRLADENRGYVNLLEQELRESQTFQMSMLPAPDAVVGGFEFCALYEPCRELCGDFYDFAPYGSGAALLVTDVAGHGAPAAMLTGMIKFAFHGAATDGFGPSVVMQRIFASSRLFPSNKHVTGLCARLHREAGTIEYVSAGHPSAYLVHAGGGFDRLDSTGPIIHPSLPDWHSEQRVVPMRKADRLLVYTDGLTEAVRADGSELYGIPRLEELLARVPAGGPGDLVRLIREDLLVFQGGRPLEDDLTIAACATRH